MTGKPPPKLYDGSDFAGRRPGAPWLLYALAAPLVFASLGALARGSLGLAILDGALAALVLAAGALTQRGADRDRTLGDRKLTAMGGVPWKTMGAVATAAAALLTSWWAAGRPLFESVALGGVAFLGYALNYGLDPLRRPPPPAVEGVSAKMVAEALDEAYGRIARIEASTKTLRCDEMRERLGRIATEARGVLRTIEEDPRDIRSARRFLAVYLESVEELTARFARTSANVESPKLEDGYRNVLAQIESAFRDQRRRMIDNDVLDLDVKIEVLSEQLAREGFAAPTATARNS